MVQWTTLGGINPRLLPTDAKQKKRMAQMTAYNESSAATVPSRLDALLKAIARRRLSASLLLFAAGHRPLAFLCSQAMYMAEPLCDVIGLAGSRELAELLSRPDEIRRIESRLLAAEAKLAVTHLSEPTSNQTPDAHGLD
jgi:hypothetical protein